MPIPEQELSGTPRASDMETNDAATVSKRSAKGRSAQPGMTALAITAPSRTKPYLMRRPPISQARIFTDTALGPGCCLSHTNQYEAKHPCNLPRLACCQQTGKFNARLHALSSGLLFHR